MPKPSRYVLWAHSLGVWVPVWRSRDGLSLQNDADACAKDGLRVTVLPEGVKP